MRRITVLTLTLLIAACSPGNESGSATTESPASTTTTTPPTTTTTIPPDFGVTSPAFADGETIPVRHTCDGDDTSPELNVVGIPEGTQTLTILVNDPDAPLGTWTHWVEFDIPAGAGSYDFPEDATTSGVPGVNSWNVEGYMGPCPPEGEEHTYYFQIYAVGSALDLPAGVDSAAVAAALDGNVLDMVELTGTYSR